MKKMFLIACLTSISAVYAMGVRVALTYEPAPGISSYHLGRAPTTGALAYPFNIPGCAVKIKEKNNALRAYVLMLEHGRRFVLCATNLDYGTHISVTGQFPDEPYPFTFTVNATNTNIVS